MSFTLAVAAIACLAAASRVSAAEPGELPPAGVVSLPTLAAVEEFLDWLEHHHPATPEVVVRPAGFAVRW